MHLQWFTGWRSFTNTTPPAKPRHGAHVGEAIWSVHFSRSSIRTVETPNCVLYIFGQCLATDTELREAVLSGRFERLLSWPGTYTTVIVNDTETVVVSDIAGKQPIYFQEVSGGCLWSSAITPLAAFNRQKPDLSVLVADMAVTGIPLGSSLPFSDIHSVPPGFALHIQQHQVSLRQWYQPWHEATFHQTAARLRKRLLDSVERRVVTYGDVSSDFSGGMDSTTLVVLATQWQRRVLGLTYNDPWVQNDDLTFATNVANDVPAINHWIVEGNRSILQFSGLNDGGLGLPKTDLPSRDVVVAAQDDWLFRVIAEVSQQHMTGEGGDPVLDSARTSFVDMYLAGHRVRAVQAASSWARRSQSSPLQTARALIKLARTSRHRALQAVIRELPTSQRVRNGIEPWEALCWYGISAAAAWLTPVGIEGVLNALSFREEGEVTVADTTRPGAYQDWWNIHACNRERASGMAIARQVGITLHTPYYDNAVIQACLSLPGYERSSVEEFKPLVRKAFPDMLPQSLLCRKTKGNFAGSIHRGLRENIADIRDIVDNSFLVSAGLLKREAILASLTKIVTGVEPLSPALDQFIGIELWLQRLNVDYTTWWEGA